MNSAIRIYSPIALIEIYLLFTLVLLAFGPVHFNIHDPLYFWAFIFSYKFSLFLGYIIGVKKVSKEPCRGMRLFSARFYYLIMVLSVFASLILYKNVMVNDSIIPLDFFEQVLLGFDDPNQAYVERSTKLQGYQGDKYLNILYFFIAFSRSLFIVLLPFYWSTLSKKVKFLSLFIIAFQLLTSLAAGINKPIFDLMIFTIFSLVTYCAIDLYQSRQLSFSRMQLLFLPVCVISCVFFVFFSYTMSSRGGDITYVTTPLVSPLGDISIPRVTMKSDIALSFYFLFAWLSYYLVQGYYGFSLALSQDFDSTFGLGNSEFLLRQWEWLTGADISHRTYQAKISELWDESGQWHSFYSHISNDVHFLGVILVMFLLGFYFSRVWISALKNNIFAKALIPLCAILVIFIPANNQVFSFIDSLSYFFVVNMLWLGSKYLLVPKNINNPNGSA